MKTFAKKRIDIMVEAPLLNRMIDLLEREEVGGYTVVPAIAGKGTSGTWHRDGQVGRVGAVVQIFCIVDESRVDDILTPIFDMVAKQIGIVTVSDVEVIRPENF
ncbi:MAG: DUF190 domain-containing protein [Pseudomonadota bacterium]